MEDSETENVQSCGLFIRIVNVTLVILIVILSCVVVVTAIGYPVRYCMIGYDCVEIVILSVSLMGILLLLYIGYVIKILVPLNPPNENGLWKGNKSLLENGVV